MDLSEFSPFSEQEWLEKIKQELKIDDISELKEKHGFTINPILRNNEIKDVASRPDNLWNFGITMELSDPQEFNSRLKNYLSWGMNAAQISIRCDGPDLKTAFDGIYLEMIYPIFEVHDLESLKALETFLFTQNHGKIGLLADQSILRASNSALFLDKLLFAKASNSFLQVIANVRALRKGAYRPFTHSILAYIGCTSQSSFHPLIELTCQSVACVTGGADIILLDAETIKDQKNLDRLALNIHHLLQMESNMQWVDDPLKGSHLIEQLTS